MIIGIVTLYNPDVSVVSNIQTIIPQVDKLYLSDNSPRENREMFSGFDKVEYYFNNGNLALSGAFNRILNSSTIKWSDEDYIIFFDQDSSIEKGHINRLIERFDRLSNRGIKVGCLGPIFFNRSTNQLAIPRIKKQISEYDYIVKSLITSSMVSKYGILKNVGFWNEDVFLDMADWDLCWRIRNKGYECIETKIVVLNHAVGTGVKKVGKITLGKTSKVREYYQTRNYLYLLNKNYVPIKYKLEFIRNLTIRPILHYLFLDNGKKRMRYIKDGIRDYKRGYFGEYKE